MVDPFSILGVVGVALQVIQCGVQLGREWKDAPETLRSLMGELQSLITVLSETSDKLIRNPDFFAAHQGAGGPLTKLLDREIPAFQLKLEKVLKELHKLASSRKVWWKRVQTALLSSNLQKTVGGLYRCCQTLNSAVVIEAAALTMEIHRGMREERAERRAMEDELVLDWLTPVDYAAQQGDYLRRRQKDTGTWLLESAGYQQWISAPSSAPSEQRTMFCPGMPGAGKTILTAVVIDDVTKRYGADLKTGVAYIYCNYKRQEEQKIEELLSSLLKQLCQSRPPSSPLPKELNDLHKRHAGRRSRPSRHELFETLCRVITATFSNVFLIVDALDECQDSNGCRTRLLEALFNLQKTPGTCGAKVFATSREIKEIADSFQSALSVEIRAADDDVRKYVVGCIRSSGSKAVKDHCEEITEDITSKAQGMFLLAQLYLEAVRNKATWKHVMEKLSGLSSSTVKPYDRVYEDTMKRIDDQDEDLEAFARRVLSWVVCAKRHLTTRELQHALAIEEGTRRLDYDNIPEVEDILAVCAGLITVDETSQVIRLVHSTAQEYFERTKTRWFTSAESDITMACVTYLSFDEFGSGEYWSNPYPQLKRWHQHRPLFLYASQNWGYHAREIPDLPPAVVEFMKMKNNVAAAVQMMVAPKEFCSYVDGVYYPYNFGSLGCGPLHLAAHFGLPQAIPVFLTLQEIDGRDTDRQTPLMWAATAGREDVVKSILDCGAGIELKDIRGRTPLLLSALVGYDVVVQTLLQRGAKADVVDIFGESPLRIAVKAGHFPVVRALINAGAGVELGGGLNRDDTTLGLAAARGNETIASFLIDNGADLEAKTRNGETPLFQAVWSGSEPLVKLLLDKRAAFDTANEDGRTPLSYAAESGHNRIVAMLLKARANPIGTSGNGVSHLSWAIRGGHRTVAELLIAAGASLESADNYGNNPLMHACIQGNNNLIKLLLRQGGSHCNASDLAGRTPIALAARRRNPKAVMDLLADRRVDPHYRDRFGATALSIAAAHGSLQTVALLLAVPDIDLESEDHFGRTVRYWARRGGHQEIERLLIEKAQERLLVLRDVRPVIPSRDKFASPTRCGICTLRMRSAERFYTCERCDPRSGSQLDICSHCFEVGARCFEDNHKLDEQMATDEW